MEYVESNMLSRFSREFIRSHPEMYVGEREFSTHSLANILEVAGGVLGVQKSTVDQCGNWTIYRSDSDWLPDDGIAGFSQINPFPEAGINSVRPEAVIAALAKHLQIKRGSSSPTYLIGKDHTAPNWGDDAKWRLQIAFCL